MNLLRNGDFDQRDGSLAGDWELFSPRDAIRPKAPPTDTGVRLAGNGSPGVWGAMVQTVTDGKEASPTTSWRRPAPSTTDAG